MDIEHSDNNKTEHKHQTNADVLLSTLNHDKKADKTDYDGGKKEQRTEQNDEENTNKNENNGNHSFLIQERKAANEEDDENNDKHNENEENVNEENEKNENEENTENINIMKIFKKFKCSRIILSYLRLSHIVSLSFLSKSLNKTVNKYYGDCLILDLSEYYGVIGSPEFDHQSFMNVFLPRFKSIQSLSLRYCSHLKVVHLDNIIKALTINNSLEIDNDKDDNIKNEKIKSLNLYFCSRLNSRALWKISSRLINLEELNLARCYAITADKNINGLKLLGSLPLKQLAISLDPSIQKAEAIDVYSLLIDEDSFRSLKVLDLSHGCEVLHEIEDLSDLTQIRKIEIIKPIKHNK